MNPIGTTPKPASAFLQRLSAIFPVAGWLPQYRGAWLGRDALAGLTLAAYAVPVSLAYATLAGVPSQVGVYCYLAGGLGYAVFGSSRHLAVGPTAGLSLLVGAALGTFSTVSPDQRPALASMCALLTAGVFGLAWLMRLSVVASFVSDSILTGFKAGAAVVIASTQIPKLMGVPGGGDSLIERLWKLGHQTGQIHGLTLAVGLGALALLWVGEKWMPRRPVALGVVILSIVVAPWLGLAVHGVQGVGPLQAGLPGPSLGTFDTTHFRELFQVAFACFLIAYVESISAARTFALKHRVNVDARQELLGLGVANLLAGLWQGYPVAGGLSQTAVNERAGARSPLALVFASVALGLVLLFLTGLFRHLPQAVLAAVVLIAVKGLIKVGELRHLWRVSRYEFIAAFVALVGVLLFGILDGVILAAVVSLLLLLTRAAHPHVAFLGRIPGTDRFSDLARHPDNESIPGALVFRVEAGLIYFNAEFILHTVLERVQTSPAGLKLVVCDLSTSPYVDLAGARMLARLHRELAPSGIKLRVVEAHAEARDILRAEGLAHAVSLEDRRVSLADVLGDVSTPGP